MTKVKLYKNPDRNNTKSYKPYVPAYEVHGLSPVEMAPATVTAAQAQLGKNVPVVSRNNPRIRPTQVFRKNMPFADVPTEASPVGQGPLPNIGNNVERSWVSVDGDDFDDVIIDEDLTHPHKASLDPNRPMVDNNDDDSSNYAAIPEEIRSAPEPQYEDTYVVGDEEDVEDRDQLDIGEDDYVLIVHGNILSIDKQAPIQEEVRSLVFGEHELNKANDITPDDIIVLKRVKIKVGVFLE